MYVLVDQQGKALVKEFNIITHTSRLFFADLKTITAINTYRTKDVTIQKFFRWFTPPSNDNHLIKKKTWLQQQLLIK